MPNIHPTSIIEPGAELADDVEIGPFCHVGPKSTLGAGTKLIGHVTVYGRTTLGARNTVWPYTILGSDPQDLKYAGEDTELTIGDDNDIRESVSIHRGTVQDGGLTRVGDHNLIMAYVHVGHDSTIGSHCVIANAVQLAGHVHIEDRANLGGASAVHHFVTVGSYAFVGGMTRVVHDVPPFMVVEGNPARVRKVNTILLKRLDFSQQCIDRLKTAFRRLYGNSENGHATGNLRDKLTALETEFPDDWAIQQFTTTLRRSADGVYGRYREAMRHDNRYANPAR
ncbi:MAG: acyl-ACP--UDP-N-acetylglucosamine O-acyltransferase [Phycisphaeraceae bacterium]